MHANDPVNRVMTTPVISIRANESVAKAIELFMSHPLHHLPVVDEVDCVLGMLSSADVMKLHFAVPTTPSKTVDAKWQVGWIMSSPPSVATEHDSIEHCAESMAKRGIHALPVVNRNGALVGIVTTTDLMRCALQPVPRTVMPVGGVSELPSLEDATIANAIALARRAVNSNRDPTHVAAALLHAQQRIAALQAVATAAKRYLGAGQDERLHTTLAKALDRADRFDEATRHPRVMGL